MSYFGTLKIVDRLSEDYDVAVQFWCEDLKKQLENTVSQLFCYKDHLVVKVIKADYPLGCSVFHLQQMKPQLKKMQLQ